MLFSDTHSLNTKWKQKSIFKKNSINFFSVSVCPINIVLIIHSWKSVYKNFDYDGVRPAGTHVHLTSLDSCMKSDGAIPFHITRWQRIFFSRISAN